MANYQPKFYENEILSEVSERIENGEVWFKLFFGTYLQAALTPLNSKPENSVERFDKLIESAYTHKPNVIKIMLFNSAGETFEKTKNPLTYRIEVGAFAQNSPQAQASGLGAIEPVINMFGGLGGIMQTNQQFASAAAQLETKKEQLTDLKSQLEKNERIHAEKDLNLKNLSEKNYELRDEIKDLKSTIGRLEEKLEAQRERFEGQRFSADRLLTVGGTVVANLMGIEGDDVAQYLGFSPKDTPKRLAPAKTEHAEPDADYVPEYTGKKKQAQDIQIAITNWLQSLIADNTEDNALDLMRNIHEISAYLADNPENVNTLVEIVKTK